MWALVNIFKEVVYPVDTVKNGHQNQWQAQANAWTDRLHVLKYRPQRSCGKVVFLHLFVSHSVHGGVSASGPGGVCYTHTHPWADTRQEDNPPGQTPPWEHTPLGRHLWADTPLGRHPPPWTEIPPGRHLRQIPPPVGQQAGDTHRTGMHSCFSNV